MRYEEWRGTFNGRGRSSTVTTCSRKPLPDVSVRYVIDERHFVSVTLKNTRKVSTRRRKELPDRLVFLCSNRITVNLPKVEGVPLSQCVLDSNVQLRDVQCMTGQNGGISRRCRHRAVKEKNEAVASNTCQAVTCIVARLAQRACSRPTDSQNGDKAPGMNLPRAAASKAQQGTPAIAQVRKTWLVLSPPRSYDGEVHAIRHPSADSMLSSVTVPLQHPPFRQTLELNAQRLPATP